MALFDNVMKAAKDVGNAATKVASNVGVPTNAAGGGKDQKELNQFNEEIKVVESELDKLYQFIGKKYADYLFETKITPETDIKDILKEIENKNAQKSVLIQEVEEVTKRIRQQDGIKEKMQERKKAEAEFATEKAKLDRALDEKVLSQDEYDVKLQIILNKLSEF